MKDVENLYLCFMRSELDSTSGFFEFRKAHEKFISENVWSTTDQLLAYYALVKAVFNQEIQKYESRAAAQRKIKNIQAEAARRKF